MHRGWIKLYRCLLDDPLWQCSTSEQKVILVTLLLMANHAERKWQWQGKSFICRPGQMITSLKSVQEKTGHGISQFQIRYALKRFEAMGFLVSKSSKTGRLITICHWETYQSLNETFHDPAAKNVSDTSQDGHTIVTPNKNEKKEKKEKKDRPSFSSLSFEEQDIARAQTANAQAIQAFMNAAHKFEE